MKIIKVSIGIMLLAFIYTSCEDVLEPNDKGSIASQLEGQWKCEENELKSTEIAYPVYISPSKTDDSKVIIGNFNQLGNSTEAIATVNGSTITLESQVIQNDYTVRGSGTISAKLNTITWLYYVDDGSGIEEDYNSVYTFQY